MVKSGIAMERLSFLVVRLSLRGGPGVWARPEPFGKGGPACEFASLHGRDGGDMGEIGGNGKESMGDHALPRDDAQLGARRAARRTGRSEEASRGPSCLEHRTVLRAVKDEPLRGGPSGHP